MDCRTSLASIPHYPTPVPVLTVSGAAGKSNFLEAMKTINFVLFSFLIFLSSAFAEVPQMINYQGRVAVNNVNFDGTGQFKFALVNEDASQTFWSNGASTVSVPVNKGLYSVLLGSAGMDAIPASVFTNTDVRLRVWFDDGVNGLQLLSPDQRIAAVGYALMSANIPDGLVTSGKLADNAVTSSKLASGAVGSSQLSPNLANGIVPWQVTSGTTQTAAANTGYLLTNAAQSVVTLPTAANVGDMVRVSGVGDGGWAVTASPDQSITGAASPAGVLWIPRESNRLWSSVASSSDGTKLVAADYTGKIYTSTDSGASWTARDENRQWQWVTASADGTKLAAVVTYGYIYTSTDSGATWTARMTDQSTRYWHSIASSADGSKLVAVVYGGQIYTSTDSGITWTARESTRNWGRVASSADGTKLIAVTQYGQIYTSTDSGVSWTPRENNRDWRAVASSADGTKLVAGVYGGQLHVSTDSGVTWIARENNRDWSAVASSADGTKLVAGVNGGQLHVSTDSGVTWTARESSRSWTQGMASSADGSKLVALEGGGKIYTSTAFSSGIQGTTAAFQYLGNGVWQPLNEALLGSGSVGSAQLTSNAVQSANIAVGAVGSAQIDPAIGLWTKNGSDISYQTGNVGIGTGTPTTALEVTGTVKATAFSGPLTGNVTGNVTGSAASFTGALAGDVTGAQGTTVVASVGGVTAANVATGANLANAATTANTPNTLVKRDASGNIPGVTVATPPPGMVLIPAGAFTMGDSLDGGETPISTTVSAFYMDVNEVTLSQWQVVQQWGTLVGGYTDLPAGSGKGATHPVQTVSWYACVKWCNARSEREGKTPVYYTDDAQTLVYRTGDVNVTNVQVKWTANGYRLPTEAEWEKAARGGLAGKRFPWGDTISQKQANYSGDTAGYAYDLGPNGYNAIGSVGGTSPATSPVGSFAANGYGLNDMAGNVLEWCWDWGGTSYAGGTDPLGAASGSYRVIRGGSWGNIADFARCAYRNNYNPIYTGNRVGFRAVLPPGQP